MIRLARRYRTWHWSRSVVLAAALAAVGTALVVESGRPSAILPLILLSQAALLVAGLLYRHLRLWADRRRRPGWQRKIDRTLLRESLWVAAGSGALSLLVLASARPEPPGAPRPPEPAQFVFRNALPTPEPLPALEPVDPPPSTDPIAVTRAPEPSPVEPVAPGPEPRPSPSTTPEPMPVPEAERPETPLYRDLRSAGLPRLPLFFQEFEEFTAPLRAGLPSRFDPEAALSVPSVSVGVIFTDIDGAVSLHGAADLDLDLDPVGREGSRIAAEMATEIAFDRRNAVRVELVGMHVRQATRAYGAMLGGAPGEEAEFSMSWEHAYIGMSHRLVGYERESVLDFALGAGLMIDILDSSLGVEGGPESELPSGERFAGAPAFSATFGVWQTGAAGLVVDFMQSVPLNLGGQSLSVTDLRITTRFQLSDRVSLVVGYRALTLQLLRFDGLLGTEDREVPAELGLAGPLLGMDIRF